MSGGAFDYAYFKVSCFAEELNEKLSDHEASGHLREATRDTLRRFQFDVEVMAEFMRHVEWLFSGDITEEQFWERMEATIKDYNLHGEQL